jgi:hypothetical protein
VRQDPYKQVFGCPGRPPESGGEVTCRRRPDGGLRTASAIRRNARINFRLGESLKGRIEQAADRAGLSVNSWLTRAAAAAAESDDQARGAQRRGARGDGRFTGWVR